jgi:hypothetical protein
MVRTARDPRIFPMTNAATIREALAERPFRAFTVHTASGREFRVPHPEHAYVSPKGRNLVVTLDDDAVKVIDMLLIEGIDHPASQPA